MPEVLTSEFFNYFIVCTEEGLGYLEGDPSAKVPEIIFDIFQATRYTKIQDAQKVADDRGCHPLHIIVEFNRIIDP